MSDTDTPKKKSTIKTDFKIAAALAVADAYFGGPEAIIPTLALYATTRLTIKIYQLPETEVKAGAIFTSAAAVMCCFWLNPVQISDNIYHPEKAARVVAIQNAGTDVMRGGNAAHRCEPYYSFLPFGLKGDKLGDVCADVQLVKRDGLAFTAMLAVDKEKPYLEAFRPAGGDAGTGYGSAIVLPENRP